MDHRLSCRRLPVALLSLSIVTPVLAEEAPKAGAPLEQHAGVEEIIVTAQKREESINDVGMSIQAATGDKLTEMGISDTSQLDKIVTGFNSNVTYYGTAIYTIRGVGFQDTSLAGSPTVSVYLDEVPLQFSAMTSGATLDLQRVEALKGPQGTLFGQNATGGAVNYIANKPTDDFESGFDASYGRFATSDVTGFVSGPITDTLKYRVAARVINSDPWQRSYTAGMTLPQDPYWTTLNRAYRTDYESGGQEFYNVRGQLQWDPTDTLTARFTISAFQDKGDSQMPQLAGIAPLNQLNTLNPLVRDYPRAPNSDARAADWGPCVNVSGGVPANVTVGLDDNPRDGFIDNTVDASHPYGIPSNISNRLYDHCKSAEKDNDFYSPSLRVDYRLTDDLTLTSLSSYSKFDRDQRLESDGTIYQDYESYQTGYLKAFFQELRLAGSVGGEGNWVVGANFEHTKTWDSFLQTYGISTAVPTQVLTATPLGPTNPNNKQYTDTYAVFGNIEYPLFDTVTVQGGLRYTNQKRDYRGCGSDGGDGSWSYISYEIQTFLLALRDFPNDPIGAIVNGDVTGALLVGPGQCASTGPSSNNFNPLPAGFTDKLDQDNVSWRTGVNWTPTNDMLLYANVSQGYKSGSFPTVASAAFVQLFPAKQEKLLAYEIGGKFGLFDGRLQLNAATFYYDYTDKQILGAINDFVFGSLPALVNVPESHVIGAEISATWEPIDGLTISPSVSYAKSEIDGTFRNFDPFFNSGANGSTKNFAGEPFPNAPEWTSNVDVQYQWSLSGGMTAFVGTNVNYQSDTKGFFYDRCKEQGQIDPVSGKPVTCTRDYLASIPYAYGNPDLKINARALVDVRAGVESGDWRVWAWGRNVTDEVYWNQVQHVNDVLLRYMGMPTTYGVTVSYRTGG